WLPVDEAGDVELFEIATELFLVDAQPGGEGVDGGPAGRHEIAQHRLVLLAMHRDLEQSPVPLLSGGIRRSGETFARRFDAAVRLRRRRRRRLLDHAPVDDAAPELLRIAEIGRVDVAPLNWAFFDGAPFDGAPFDSASFSWARGRLSRQGPKF